MPGPDEVQEGTDQQAQDITPEEGLQVTAIPDPEDPDNPIPVAVTVAVSTSGTIIVHSDKRLLRDQTRVVGLLFQGITAYQNMTVVEEGTKIILANAGADTLRGIRTGERFQGQRKRG